MTSICSVILAFMLSIGGGVNLSVHLSEKPHPGLKIETSELRPIQTKLNQEQQPVLRFFIRNSRLGVRFLQTDPMGYEDSLNLYQAFNMNPVNFVDPMGELIKAEFGKNVVFRTEKYKTGRWWLDYTIVGAFNELRNTAALGINLGTNLLGIGGEVQEKVLDVADYGAYKFDLSNNRGDVKEALEFMLIASGTNPNAVRMGTRNIISKGKKVYKGVKDFIWKFFGKAKTANLGSISGHIGAKVPKILGKYKTTPMKPQYIGEETGSIWGTKVKYLSDVERRTYTITVKEGKLYDYSGKLFDTSQASSVFAGGQGNAIFVMDESGNIYASTKQVVGKFHHSSFLSGRPVAAAGEISVKNGIITSITRRSGHYTPAKSYLGQFITEIERLGVNVKVIKIGDGF